MPEILTDAYLLFTFVFKQALNMAGSIQNCFRPFLLYMKSENKHF